MFSIEDPFPDIDFEALENELRKEGLYVNFQPCQTSNLSQPLSECTVHPVQQGVGAEVGCPPDHLDFLPDLPLSPRLQSQFNLLSQTEDVTVSYFDVSHLGVMILIRHIPRFVGLPTSKRVTWGSVSGGGVCGVSTPIPGPWEPGRVQWITERNNTSPLQQCYVSGLTPSTSQYRHTNQSLQFDFLQRLPVRRSLSYPL